MADDIAVTPGSGATIATDEVSSRHYQLIKLMYGPDGSVTMVSTSNGLPVQFVSGSTVAATQSGSWSVSVSGTVAVTQSGSWTVSLAAGTAAIGTVSPTGYSSVSVTTFANTSSAELKAANASRKGLIISNRSDAGTLHVLLGSGTASATSRTLSIAAGGYWEAPAGFTGAVQAIIASGTADVTELS